MKFIAARIELFVAILFLWVSEGIFWPPISYFSQKEAAPDTTDPISTAIHTIFLGFLLVVAVIRHNDMRLAFRCGWPILALVGLAFLSAFWSDQPELVLRRSLTLSVTTVVAAYLAVRFAVPQLISILVKLSAFAILCSFVVIVVAPSLATGASVEYPNALRGAFSAKNTLGGISAMGIIFAFYALLRGYGPRLIAAGVVLGALVLLYVSQSATSLLLPIGAAYTGTVAVAFRQRNGFGLIVGFTLVVAGLIAIAVLALAWTDILPLLGRNATLTGRVEIWRTVIVDIGHRPWLGFGFGAFWGHNTLEAWMMWQRLYWVVPHAHNGWLEVGLALGIVGMGAMLLVWLLALYRGFASLIRAQAEHAAFWLAIFTALLVENMTEYEFLKADTIFWVVFVIAFVDISREVLACKTARPARAALVPAHALPGFAASGVGLPR